MYKNRIGIWATILTIYVLVSILLTIDIGPMLIKNKEINVAFQADASLKSAFKENIKGLNMNIVTNDADVIIKNSSDSDIDGYTKINDYIYTPIVAYYPAYFKTSTITYTINSKTFFVDMNELADAVLNDKTVGDFNIAVREDYFDNKLILCLPGEGTLYYDQVIEAIYIGLNNNKVPTEEERAALSDKVNELLEKAETCNDIYRKISTLEWGDYYVFLGPETVMSAGGYFGTSPSNTNFFPAYFEKSPALKYDIFVKNDKENIEDIVKETIINNKYFVDKTTYRTTYSHNYSEHLNCSSIILKEVELAN